MIYLGDSSLNTLLYTYSIRYKTKPSVYDFKTWKEILDIYKLPPNFNQESKEIIICRIPNTLLEGLPKKEKHINLKTEFQREIDYREVILLAEINSKEEVNKFNTFLHKNKTWIKYLDSNSPEVISLYKILRKVFTPEAYEWLITNHKKYPLRIKEEIQWWAHQVNTNKRLISINQVRQDLGEYEENTKWYCYHLGTPLGNEILLDMKSNSIWVTFFSINNYKSPVSLYIERKCSPLIISLDIFKYAVDMKCVGIKEGALILNAWWDSVIKDRRNKPWEIDLNIDSLIDLRKALRVRRYIS